jgi:hypothetical protein
MTVAEVMEAFAHAWNADDDAGRLRLLAAACVPDAVFVAPQGTLTGIGALGASIGAFRRVFPAAAVTFGATEEHGGFLRVAWATTWNTGQPDLTGEDFGELSADGRIRLLVSFDGLRSQLPDHGTRCRQHIRIGFVRGLRQAQPACRGGHQCGRGGAEHTFARSWPGITGPA